MFEKAAVDRYFYIDSTKQYPYISRTNTNIQFTDVRVVRDE